MQGRLVGLEEPLLGQVGSFHPKKRYSDSSEKRAEYKVTLTVEIANFSQPGGIPLHPLPIDTFRGPSYLFAPCCQQHEIPACGGNFSRELR